MKILQVGKYYPPYRGGMETVLENLVEGLLDAGVQVSTIVSGQDQLDRFSTVKGPESGQEGQLTRISRVGQINSQPLNPSLIAHLRQQIENFKPDLVHLHLPNPLAVMAWTALAGCYGKNIPPLAIWHHADITRQKFGAKLVKPLGQDLLRRCRGVCVSTESLAANSACLKNFESKTKVIPFGIKSEPWINIQPLHRNSMLFVGRLVPYKGLEVLLDAVQEVSHMRLDIVGHGPLFSFLEKKIIEGNLGDRVLLHRECTEDQLVELMTSARALVLPSLDESETFGLVQLEAMASGIPVIASNLSSGVSEVGVEDETCLLVRPGDKEDLARTLQKILNDDNLAERLGQASRERYLLHFTREVMVERIIDWYQHLLSSK